MDKPLLADRMLDNCDLRDRRAWRWPMLSLVILGAGLLLCTPGEMRAYNDVEDNDAKLREEAREVVSQYAKDFDEYVKALRQSKTREQRDKADEKRPKSVPSAARLVSWAERNPKDPVAVDLLVTVVSHGRLCDLFVRSLPGTCLSSHFGKHLRVQVCLVDLRPKAAQLDDAQIDDPLTSLQFPCHP